MALPIVLTTDQKGMLLRLVTNYLSGMTETSALTPHQVAFLTYVLAMLPPMSQQQPQDQMEQARLRMLINTYYQNGGG